MVTCVRPSLNSMLPMAPVNPFVVGLTPSVAAAAATGAAGPISNHTTTTPTPTTIAIATMTTPTKPKLAFSIDAIVGGNATNNNKIQPSASLSPIAISQRSESPDDFERSPRMLHLQQPPHCQQPLELRNSFPVIYTRPTTTPTTTPPQRGLIYCRRRSSLDREYHSPSRSSTPQQRCRSRSPLRSPNSPSTTPNHNLYSPAAANHDAASQQKDPSRHQSPSPTPNPNNSPTAASKAAPILVPGLLPAGLIRPLPLPPPLQPPPPQNQRVACDMPTMAQSTHQTALSTHPAISTQGQPAPPPLPPPPSHPPNPHFLAAQFQMAAALAHHHQQQQQQQQQQQHQQHHLHHPPPHMQPAHPMGIFPPGPHHPHFGSPHLIRDSYPLYPWLLSRHGRIFPHRFPGFLLQPFRKPKRVRTAFSPTQLLKLEHAFEGNHYVVGAERKQLAQGLSLTETQVKVWFQNRRTKHKRMQQEGGDDGDSKSNKGDNDGKNDSSQHSYSDHEDDEIDEHDEDGECVGDGDVDDDDEDEVIDMDDYGSEMDAEEQQRMREHLQQQANRAAEHHSQHSPFLTLQQQQNLQQQHQQFMQHQLYLQQQHHHHQQQQQQQQQQKQP